MKPCHCHGVAITSKCMAFCVYLWCHRLPVWPIATPFRLCYGAPYGMPAADVTAIWKLTWSCHDVLWQILVACIVGCMQLFQSSDISLASLHAWLHWEGNNQQVCCAWSGMTRECGLQAGNTSRKMGCAAQDHVRQKFSRQAFGDQLNTILKGMCEH